MIVVCNSCSAKFHVKASDIGVNGRFVRCSQCGHEWLAKAVEESEFDASEVGGNASEADNNTSKGSAYNNNIHATNNKNKLINKLSTIKADKNTKINAKTNYSSKTNIDDNNIITNNSINHYNNTINDKYKNDSQIANIETNPEILGTSYSKHHINDSSISIMNKNQSFINRRMNDYNNIIPASNLGKHNNEKSNNNQNFTIQKFLSFLMISLLGAIILVMCVLIIGIEKIDYISQHFPQIYKSYNKFGIYQKSGIYLYKGSARIIHSGSCGKNGTNSCENCNSNITKVTFTNETKNIKKEKFNLYNQSDHLYRDPSIKLIQQLILYPKPTKKLIHYNYHNNIYNTDAVLYNSSGILSDDYDSKDLSESLKQQCNHLLYKDNNIINSDIKNDNINISNSDMSSDISSDMDTTNATRFNLLLSDLNHSKIKEDDTQDVHFQHNMIDDRITDIDNNHDHYDKNVENAAFDILKIELSKICIELLINNNAKSLGIVESIKIKIYDERKVMESEFELFFNKILYPNKILSLHLDFPLIKNNISYIEVQINNDKNVSTINTNDM